MHGIASCRHAWSCVRHTDSLAQHVLGLLTCTMKEACMHAMQASCAAKRVCLRGPHRRLWGRHGTCAAVRVLSPAHQKGPCKWPRTLQGMHAGAAGRSHLRPLMELTRLMTAATLARYMARQPASVKKCWCADAVGLHATKPSTPPVVPQLFTNDSSTCPAQRADRPCHVELAGIVQAVHWPGAFAHLAFRPVHNAGHVLC